MQAENGMRLNEYLNQSTKIYETVVPGVLIPHQSLGDKQISRSLESIDSLLNSEDTALVDILKYTFILRYLSNNQIMVLSSLLECYSPINLHLATQALSSGLKPRSEKFQQSSGDEPWRYRTLFSGYLEAAEITSKTSAQSRKLSLSGYTNNLLINDPLFSQMFLLYSACLILLLPPLLYQIFRVRQPQALFYSSVTFKFFLFAYSQLCKMAESSLLNILLSNYLLFSDLG